MQSYFFEATTRWNFMLNAVNLIMVRWIYFGFSLKILSYLVYGTILFTKICFGKIVMVWDLGIILVHLGCHNRIPETDGLQMTNIYFSKFWKLRSPDQGSGRFTVWWKPIFRFMGGHPLHVSSHGKRGEGTLGGPFYKVTNPTHEGSILTT